jgi:hypothetical protein
MNGDPGDVGIDGERSRYRPSSPRGNPSQHRSVGRARVCLIHEPVWTGVRRLGVGSSPSLSRFARLPHRVSQGPDPRQLGQRHCPVALADAGPIWTDTVHLPGSVPVQPISPDGYPGSARLRVLGRRSRRLGCRPRSAAGDRIGDLEQRGLNIHHQVVPEEVLQGRSCPSLLSETGTLAVCHLDLDLVHRNNMVRLGHRTE